MQPQQKLDPLTETALRSIRDIAVPPPVSWFPQTWGWFVLAALLVLALLAWLTFAMRRYRRNAYRREALRLLTTIEQGTRDPAGVQKDLCQLVELLKRTALAAWPREKVARISGPAWISFLDASEENGVGRTLSRFLKETEYRGNTAVSGLSPKDVGEIIQDARRWIEGHHVSA